MDDAPGLPLDLSVPDMEIDVKEKLSVVVKPRRRFRRTPSSDLLDG